MAIPSQYLDIFPEDAKTVVLDKNPLATLLSLKEGEDIFSIDRRPDRILAHKQTSLSLVSQKVIGDIFAEKSVKAIQEKLPKTSASHLYVDNKWPPSDHFGLLAVFSIN